MQSNLKDKIQGSFAGVAVGDALGMPLHELTSDEIKERCNGRATTFFPIWSDEFIHLDYKCGQFTDDTMLTIVTADAILKYHGDISSDQFVRELATWVENNETIWRHGRVFGPTTKAAFSKLLSHIYDGYKDRSRDWCSTGVSNGSIMRISPAGWARSGNIEGAVDLACKLALPTHPTDVALSAASAQAAAVAEALSPKASVSSIMDAMLKGAKMGEEIGRKTARIISHRYPLPNLEIALELAEKAKDPFEAGDKIRRVIGSHLHASEALATAAGIFYAAKGDTQTSIIAAINNGGDTDTIGSMVGALAGALNGFDSVPKAWVKTVEEVNHIEFSSIASQMAELNA
ncbi:MAG: ADP-ribosylglycohydrolase family protein [Anaerolineaceae bacterium]